MTLADIRNTVLGNRQTIRNFGVREIGFFGSFVRGEQRADSDIDLLVVFEDGQLSFRHYMDLCFYLEDLLGRKVDVLTPEQISPHIMPYVQNNIKYVTV